MLARCPKCGQTGSVEGPAIGVSNDNVITVQTAKDVDVPDGFRIVVFGWKSPYENLCCMRCGVPAELSTH